MQGRTAKAGHHIHSLLVPFPIACWLASLASDLIYLSGFRGLIWKDIALYSMAAGVGGGLAAMMPVYLAYRKIKDQLTMQAVERHMLVDLSLIFLFCINVLMRVSTDPQALSPVALSFGGIVGAAVSGWLGEDVMGAEQRRQPAAPKREAA